MNKMELLAPAGSLEALEAAVESGADAVYIGGSKFNARAYADNLDEDMLKKAVEYAHIRGVRVYITVNILILQNELREVIEYIRYLYSIQADAVILQDIGLAMLVKKLLPDFEVHCSTQMAIHNTDGASVLHELGFKRVVLARELSLQEINKVAENTSIDTEIFIHGALCVCYSGQCYMSSLIGGRSGNRGKCAQPCRKKYSLFETSKQNEIQSNYGSYLISTRDLNTYGNLNAITASSAVSLKIEGRMKRPEYVAIITHNYREALDCLQKGEKQCISEQAAYELRIAFNREFTEGYMFNKRNQEIVNSERPDNRGIYIGRVLNQKGNIVELLMEDNFLNDGDAIEIRSINGKSIGSTISGIKKENNTVKSAKAGDKIRIFITDRVTPGSIVNKTIDSKLFHKAREEYAYKNKKKIAVRGIFNGKINKPPTLVICDNEGHKAEVIGDEYIQRAQKLAMTEDKVAEQLNKTKDTPYVLNQLEIDIEANSFLSVKAINNLRREAIELLSAQRVNLHHRSLKEFDLEEIRRFLDDGVSSSKAEKELIAGVANVEAGLSAIRGGADSLYILGDYRYNENLKLIEELSAPCIGAKCSLFYVLPQITRDVEVRSIEMMLQQAMRKNDGLGLVISNIGHIKIAERLKNRKLRSNFSMNAVNGATAAFLKKQGMQSICISPELNLSQIKDLSQASNVELEAIVYGYLPAMITEYCPKTAASECDACNNSEHTSYGILDEKYKLFRIVNMGNCKSMILNSDVLCVYENLANIIDSGIHKLRLDFYFEKDKDIFEIVKAYKEKLYNLSDNSKSNVIDELKKNGYTKGHYFRGIE
ncbi:MAG: hypothetical protein A2Y23_05395 [Clostridiales bacterium GWB2_37_7]|nr:MAG: hypothetical protein A2Y23_05395 [Clostridiales bacterium GWB2_37_7]